MILRICSRIGRASGPYSSSKLSNRIISAVIWVIWVLCVSNELFAAAISKPSTSAAMVPIRPVPSRTTHLPIPLCTLGVVRDFPDFGTEPAVFGADDDFERAPPTCPRAAMKIWLHMSALCQEQTLGRPLAMIVFGTVL